MSTRSSNGLYNNIVVFFEQKLQLEHSNTLRITLLLQCQYIMTSYDYSKNMPPDTVQKGWMLPLLNGKMVKLKISYFYEYFGLNNTIISM